jgi:hypothetical protein
MPSPAAGRGGARGRDPDRQPGPCQEGGNYNREPHAVQSQSFPLKLIRTLRRGPPARKSRTITRK